MKKILTLMAGIVMTAMTVSAEGIQIIDASINNVCLNKNMMRMSDRDQLFVDNTGIGMEVSIQTNIQGHAGKRFICIVNPLDEDEELLADSKGEAMNMVGFDVNTNSYSKTIVVPLPQQWLTKCSNGKVNIEVTIVCPNEEGLGELKVFNLGQDKINIKRDQLGKKMMNDAFGGSGGLAGMLLEGLFDTSDATSEEECPSCEGYKICPYCDGDGFFDPSLCRKCQDDPGICRRCKGEGTVTRKYDIY